MRLLLALLCTFSGFETAGAQHSLLQPGARLRLGTPCHPSPSIADCHDGPARMATLVQVRGDSLLVRWKDDGEEVLLPPGAYPQMEVAVRHHRAGRGAVVGVISGTVIGLLAATTGSQSCRNSDPAADDVGLCNLLYFLVPPSALVGLTVGALIGSQAVKDEWRSVP